jgi:urease subunit gamma
LAGNGDRCYFAETVRENEEVVPVNISTWVLLFGVTVGR